MNKVKPFCIATKDLTFDQACEVFDKSIKAGAEPYEGITDWSSSYDFSNEYTYSEFPYIGVNNNGDTYMEDYTLCFIDSEDGEIDVITLEQLDEHLGLKKSNTQEHKDTFTKSDLEAGMIVQVTGDEYYVVLSDKVLYKLNYSGNSWMCLDSFSEDLIYNNSICKVEKVFKPKQDIEHQYNPSDLKYNDIIWDRSKSEKRQQLINKINDLQEELSIYIKNN